MDFSAFSEAEFSAAGWINAALASAETPPAREEAASALAMKLQLFIGEVRGGGECQ